MEQKVGLFGSAPNGHTSSLWTGRDDLTAAPKSLEAAASSLVSIVTGSVCMLIPYSVQETTGRSYLHTSSESCPLPSSPPRIHSKNVQSQ